MHTGFDKEAVLIWLGLSYYSGAVAGKQNSAVWFLLLGFGGSRKIAYSGDPRPPIGVEGRRFNLLFTIFNLRFMIN